MGNGFIDTVEHNQVKGWAITGFDSEPADVDLYVNGEFVQSTQASGHRPGIQQKGLHSTGNCEYRFNLESPLKTGDIVNVYINANKQALLNGPWIVNKPKKDDVLIIGLPKSGTSILTYKIAGAYKNSEVVFEPKNSGKLSELLKFHGKKLATPKTVISKCLFPWHTDYSSLVEVSKLYSKVVFIVRDPRDNMISSFFYVWNKLHNPAEDKFNKALEITLKKEQNPAEVPFFEMDRITGNPREIIARKYNSIIKCHKDFGQNWYVLKYEDLMDESNETLEEYLSVTLAKAEVPPHLSRVVRSKKYGNWKDWYTSEDIESYQPVVNPILDYFGYDTFDWKINNPKSIDPKNGSDYMKKMFYGTK